MALVVWNGTNNEYTCFYGKFRRLQTEKVSDETAKNLLKLSKDFTVIFDNEDNSVIANEKEQKIITIDKKEELVNNVCFSREYGLGDIIMCAYFVCRAAKINSPSTKITFAIPKQYTDFFSTMDFIDEVVSLPIDFETRRKFDKFIDLNSFPLFHNKSTTISRPEMLSSAISDPLYYFDKYTPPNEYTLRAENIFEVPLKEKKSIIGLAFISNSKVRTYDPVKMSRLIEILSKKYFVILFGKDEYHWGIGKWNGNNVFSSIDRGYDLTMISALMSKCSLIITTDNGLLHLAGIQKIPTIALFGNILPELRIKFYPSVTSIYKPEVSTCIPCNDKHNPCIKTKDEFGGLCLNSISVDDIIERAKKILEVTDYKEAELVNRIKWMSTVEKLVLEPEYPYIANKNLMDIKSNYKLMIVIPHIFMGGGETQLLYLINSLKYFGYEIRVVVAGPVDEELFPIISSVAEFSVLDSKDRINFIKYELKNFKPDIVLYHGTDYLNYALENTEIKPIIIQILHTGIGAWTEDVLRISYKWNDAMICVADWIRKKFSKIYTDGKFITVLNGAPARIECNESYTKELGIKKGDITFGILSRLSGGKGIEELIDSLEFLPDNFKLLIGGWGDLEDKLKERAKKFPGRIFFLGVVHNREKFFNSINIAILASYAEGNSMFLLEAAMNKVPIISTPVGATPELFQDLEYSIHISLDEKDIANKIMFLSSNKFTADKIKNNAYKKISVIANSDVMSQGYNAVMLSEISRRTNPKSILFYRIAGIGDILMSTPAVRYIRKILPNAFITYVSSKLNSEILVENPNVDALSSTHKSFLNLSREFDLAYEFAHYEVWDNKKHIIEKYLEIVDAPLEESREMDIYLNDIKNFPVSKKMACMHVSSNFTCKDWGNNNDWNVIREYLVGKGYEVINIDGSYNNRKLNVRETAKLISQAKLLIGIDSFPIHAARASNIPTIAVYGGASDPIFCGYKENINIVSEDICKCNASKTTDITCKHNYRCLKSISTELILKAIDKI